MKTLEQILNDTKNAKEEGIYGLKECRECIKAYLDYSEECNLYLLLQSYVKKANEDVFFNERMVQACWQLINE